MKRAFKVAVITATGVALAAPLAAQADGRWDQGRHDDGRIARVLRVQPIVRVVRVPGPPVQRCTTEQVAYSRERHGDAVGATLVGGVIGGLIGNRLGNEDRNPVATVAGAIIGGAIGHSLGERGATVVRPVTVCQSVRAMRSVEQVRGYRVTYRYHGQIYATRTSERPGRFLRVH